MISAAAAPKAATALRARVFWLHETPLETGTAITVRIGTAEARGTITAIPKAVDPGALTTSGYNAIAQNHVGEILIALSRPLAADTYDANPQTGRVVLDLDGRIAGGGLILRAEADNAARTPRKSAPDNIVPIDFAVSTDERAERTGH